MYKFANGKVIEGVFKNSDITWVKMTYLSGHIYVGNIDHGCSHHGFGTLTYPDGKVVKGQWNGSKCLEEDEYGDEVNGVNMADVAEAI